MEEISKVLPGWKVVGKIGQGSYGRVYHIVKEGYQLESALKVIDIPRTETERLTLFNMGMDGQSVSTFIDETARDVMKEVQVMEQLRGAPSVVNIEDCLMVPHEDGPGCSILIRMELLQSLDQFLARRKSRCLTREETIRLGTDLCRALEVCEEKRIIHRDIKPSNIFVDPFGTFKLGDFGIAREMEETTMATYSQKGTGKYMAPEVSQGGKYDARVDLYSLGIVLYRYLNHCRFPFEPAAPAPMHPSDVDRALSRRLAGEALPAPDDADAQLASVVLRACEADPKRRWRTAGELRRALEACRGDGRADEPVLMDEALTGAAAAGTEGAAGTASPSGSFSPTPPAQEQTPGDDFGEFVFTDAAPRRPAEDPDETVAIRPERAGAGEPDPDETMAIWPERSRERAPRRKVGHMSAGSTASFASYGTERTGEYESGGSTEGDAARASYQAPGYGDEAAEHRPYSAYTAPSSAQTYGSYVQDERRQDEEETAQEPVRRGWDGEPVEPIFPWQKKRGNKKSEKGDKGGDRRTEVGRESSRQESWQEQPAAKREKRPKKRKLGEIDPAWQRDRYDPEDSYPGTESGSETYSFTQTGTEDWQEPEREPAGWEAPQKKRHGVGHFLITLLVRILVLLLLLFVLVLVGCRISPGFRTTFIYRLNDLTDYLYQHVPYGTPLNHLADFLTQLKNWLWTW